MFTHPLFLITLLSITVFSSAVELFVSTEEMNDMGIRLENREAREQIVDF